jgi:hypothetical protein
MLIIHLKCLTGWHLLILPNSEAYLQQRSCPHSVVTGGLLMQAQAMVNCSFQLLIRLKKSLNKEVISKVGTRAKRTRKRKGKIARKIAERRESLVPCLSRVSTHSLSIQLYLTVIDKFMTHPHISILELQRVAKEV